jgi:hypothetical protein
MQGKLGIFLPVTQYKIHESPATGHVAGISYTKREDNFLWGKIIEEVVGRFALKLILVKRTGWVGGERTGSESFKKAGFVITSVEISTPAAQLNTDTTTLVWYSGSENEITSHTSASGKHKNPEL